MAILRSPLILTQPGHSDIPDNCTTDEQALEGTLLSISNHAHDAGLPLSASNYMLKLAFAKEADSR